MKANEINHVEIDLKLFFCCSAVRAAFKLFLLVNPFLIHFRFIDKKHKMEGAVVQEVSANQIKLFGKWNCDDVSVEDISLQDYIPIKGKAAKYLPHTAGRYQVKRFRKALCPIVERLVCSLMMHGRNNGKKIMAVRIVKNCFDIIHLLTGENPLKILVDAIKNSGPREDSTRIGRAGTVRRQAVDVSPLRRVNQAIWLLCTGKCVPLLILVLYNSLIYS